MNPRVYVIVHVSRSCEIIFQNGGFNNFHPIQILRLQHFYFYFSHITSNPYYIYNHVLYVSIMLILPIQIQDYSIFT